VASYRGHLKLAAPLGLAYGGLAFLHPDWQTDWAPAVLGAGACTLGGLAPDLDSDSGVPVREMFGVSAAALSAIAYFPLRHRLGMAPEQALVVAAALYFLIRYGVSELFSKMTVHRGMFHSLPAMAIAGLIVYMLFPTQDPGLKAYLGGATMLGFLSHLVLDEIYSVDFSGVAVRFNKFAGSAVKFGSSSWPATLTCYVLLVGLGYAAWESTPESARPQHWQRPAWLSSPAEQQQPPPAAQAQQHHHEAR
jgi:hypothetical protein